MSKAIEKDYQGMLKQAYQDYVYLMFEWGRTYTNYMQNLERVRNGEKPE